MLFTTFELTRKVLLEGWGQNQVLCSWEDGKIGIETRKKMCVCVHHSAMSNFVTRAPLSMGFSRQEHWSGLPVPSPGDLPDPEIKPRSPTQGRK